MIRDILWKLVGLEMLENTRKNHHYHNKYPHHHHLHLISVKVIVQRESVCCRKHNWLVSYRPNVFLLELHWKIQEKQQKKIYTLDLFNLSSHILDDLIYPGWWMTWSREGRSKAERKNPLLIKSYFLLKASSARLPACPISNNLSLLVICIFFWGAIHILLQPLEG